MRANTEEITYNFSIHCTELNKVTLNKIRGTSPIPTKRLIWTENSAELQMSSVLQITNFAELEKLTSRNIALQLVFLQNADESN